MPFAPITVNTQTFNAAGEGRYMKSTVSFGSPLNYIKVSPGNFNPKTKLTTFTVTRHIEKDVTIGSDVVREAMEVSLRVTSPRSFSSTEVDGAVSDISEFLTPAILDRGMNGEA